MNRIAISAGEPAGIGPELIASLNDHTYAAEIVVFGDPDLIKARAKQLNKSIKINLFNPSHYQPGKLTIAPIATNASVTAGKLNLDNANYVINCIKAAADACLTQTCQAMVTLPIQKSVIHQINSDFTGHTEFLRDHLNAQHSLMLMVSKTLKVALQTVHMPLSSVSQNISTKALTANITLLAERLSRDFAITNPTIAVLGLNPHAGEKGTLGQEELAQIEPAIKICQSQGLNIKGPYSADSAFAPTMLEKYDAYLAMYHDQGLIPFKTLSFNQGVNMTLGLPIIRTSVDHGTALDIAGTGKANCDSLHHALDLSLDILQKRSDYGSSSPP